MLFRSIVSGALSFFTDNIPLQAAVGVLVSFILVVFVRPILQRTMNINQEVRPSTIHALIDVEGIVTKTITDTEFGLVKVNGETWTAKTMDGDCLEEGERIIVKGISGVKLEVIPVKPVRKKRTHKKEE